jgi:acyl-CoA synthetase (AMP-forming)/AMP-acid ligase II
MITAEDYVINPGSVSTRSSDYSLPAVFRAAVRSNKDQPAVFESGRWRSWREWEQEALALGRALQELGVKPGEVVALHLPNCWEYLTLHVAISSIGAVMFPLHMAYGEHELKVLLRRAEVSVIVLPTTYHTRDMRETGRRLLAELPALRYALFVGAEVETQKDEEEKQVYGVTNLLKEWRGAELLPVTVDQDDPFVLLASSGTTSLRPKICIHTHFSLLANAGTVSSEGRASAADVILSASPFTHLFGLLSIHLSLFSRGKQALLGGWKTENFLELAANSGATVAFAVPTQLRDVCIYQDNHPKAPRLSLREVRTGGASVPAQLVADVRRVLDAGVIVQWGMSEVGAGTFTRPEDPPEAASRSIGRQVGGAEVRIIGEDGRELPEDEAGELCYRGPYLFRGYLGDRQVTEQALTPDGWLKTGDLASRNADGTLAYRGRRTEFINRGGLKFSAVEVESLLVDLSALNQFAVIAREDERLGQRSLLVASLRPGYNISLEDVTAHLAAKNLARYKWPEQLIVVEELPATPTGKIARARLAELLPSKLDK